MADKKRFKIVTSALDEGKLNIWSQPDDDGEQVIDRSYTPDYEKAPEAMRQMLYAYGFAQIAANSYNRLDAPTPQDVFDTMVRIETSIHDGTWVPGRSFTSEPSDIALAIAEATNTPVHIVQRRIDEDLVRDDSGNPVKDSRGRNKRVFTKAMLDAFSKEPAVATILARMAAQRARDAKKDGSTGVMDMFKTATPEAAN